MAQNVQISVKLISYECGVYSRRVLVANDATIADLQAALGVAAGTPLLYRETSHRCSELVQLATDR